MKKRQWRKLVTELLEMRNELAGDHICVTSQMEELSNRLRAIERRLPPEPDFPPISSEQLEEYSKKVDEWAADYRRMWAVVNAEPDPDWRTYEIMPDGTRRECEE